MSSEALILAVQRRQPLYDKTDDNYSNRIYISKQWKEIGNELGIDEQTARKKWTTLRDYFQKSHKQLTTAKSGSAAVKKRKWYLYDSMQFLLPHITERKTCSNLSDDSNDDGMSNVSETSFLGENLFPGPSSNKQETDTQALDSANGQAAAVAGTLSQETDTQALDSANGQAAAVAGTLSQASTSGHAAAVAGTQSEGKISGQVSGIRKRKAKFPQKRAQTESLDRDILQAIKVIGERPTVPKDEDELFFQSLVPKIKMLDPLAKMECQAEILMLILKYVRRAYSQ